MEKLTKTGLIDKCIDGDDKKLIIFGNMFDLFSCMYSVLQNSNVSNMPDVVAFTTSSDTEASFDIGEEIEIDSDGKKKSEEIFGHRVTVQKSKKATKIKVCG